MPKFQYGLAKFEVGTMNPTTGEITDWREVKVYQDTCVIDRPEAQKTEHYAQGDSDPSVIRYGRTAKTVALSVFDRSVDSKVEWLGGTKTSLNGVDSWNAPSGKKAGITKKAYRLTFEDGSIAVAPNMSCAARDSWNPNDTDVAVIPVIATVQATGVAAVGSWTETDAPEETEDND